MSDYETDKYIKHLESQIEKLQGEIERLKPFASAYENINEYFCGEDIVAKYESSQLELAQLTAKHERMVKGLKGLTVITSYDHHGRFGEEWDSVNYSEITKLLTEEGNV